ncbi:hypothetical protein DRO37_03960 [Candidatus Bathyarchaeota archaeon]|nr:MAG: hypothetical protein DRO37_03960 [Candidatus Bathyarchaeota archaeon]
MKKRTCIILAGGSSERLGCDKGLMDLAGKPLIQHVYDRVKGYVDEVLVVVSSAEQRKRYSRLFPPSVKVLMDFSDGGCPLIGALTGFMEADGVHSVLLPCDTPFISGDVIELLFEATFNVNASIPRWPNGYIEPLQAVYRTRPALKAAEIAFKNGERRMQSMISRLRRVRYISTIVLREFDPHLLSLFNVNTPLDLRRAERIIGATRGREPSHGARSDP